MRGGALIETLCFARTRGELVKSILYTLAAGLLGFVLAAAFGGALWLRLLAAAVLACLTGPYLIIGEGIRVELNAANELSVYRTGRKLHRFTLPNFEVVSPPPRRRTTMTAMFLHLFPKNDEAKKEMAAGQKRVRLDLAPLGKHQYTQLCQALQNRNLLVISVKP